MVFIIKNKSFIIKIIVITIFVCFQSDRELYPKDAKEDLDDKRRSFFNEKIE
jgi:hypothetical protein